MVFGPNDTTMIIAGDDNIVRIIPVFPNDIFKKVYELKGHRDRVLGI